MVGAPQSVPVDFGAFDLTRPTYIPRCSIWNGSCAAESATRRGRPSSRSGGGGQDRIRSCAQRSRDRSLQRGGLRSFSGTPPGGEVAPIPAVRGMAIEPQGSTHSGRSLQAITMADYAPFNRLSWRAESGRCRLKSGSPCRRRVRMPYKTSAIEEQKRAVSGWRSPQLRAPPI